MGQACSSISLFDYQKAIQFDVHLIIK